MADAGVLNAVRTLKLEVRQAFIDVQLAQENLALARENAASLQEIVTLNQARVRGGDVAEVELLRSRPDRRRSDSTLVNVLKVGILSA